MEKIQELENRLSRVALLSDELSEYDLEAASMRTRRAAITEGSHQGTDSAVEGLTFDPRLRSVRDANTVLVFELHRLSLRMAFLEERERALELNVRWCDIESPVTLNEFRRLAMKKLCGGGDGR